MSTMQARHRGHNIPEGVTTFNEIEYDREGGVFLNRTKLILLAVIVFLLTAFSAFVGRYSAERQFREYINRDSFVKKAAESGVPESQIPFLAVEPECYKVFLEPKLYAPDGTVPKHDVTYDGRVEVIFRPKTDTAVISLHVGLLKIDGDLILKRRLSMETPTEQVLQDDTKYELDTQVNETLETMTVTVSEVLKAGHYYSLFVSFTGTIGRNPEQGGFYKIVFDSAYKPVVNHWYVATKLTPRKARHLLPCVDNPKHKAIFEVSVVRNHETRVIFNTKLRETEQYNDILLIDHFEKTGLIRPDSLGLFMSNFQSQSVETDGLVEVRTWSRQSTDKIRTIKEIVPTTLNFIKSYLATDFPTNKLDIVIVPEELISSAESPGLIVIKDTVLDNSENDAELPLLEHQNIVETLMEHVIRQWMMPLRGLDRECNEDKWLNDAIVKFLRILNTDNILPDWTFGSRFPLHYIQPVMFYDSWTNSEPLSNYEQHTEIYKYISSDKGTSILRMLNYTFTEDIFKQTLREYVHTEIYKYKDTISFWTLLDDNARNKSIKLPENSAVLQIVNSWIQNKNYPLVTVYTDGDDLVLKQFRFDYNELKPTNDWVIPVTLTSGAAYSTTVWLENSPEIRVPGYNLASNGTWILANQYQTGYYRVIYQDVLMDRISYEISKGKSFDEYVVSLLVADIFEGAFAGIVGFSDALGFLERVINNAKSTNGFWVPVFNAFRKLETVFHSTRHYNNLSIFMEMAAEKAYGLFQNLKTDTFGKLYGKVEMLKYACRMETNECVLWAKEQFDKWKTSQTEQITICPNRRTAVYCTAMQYATKQDHRFMMRKYYNSKWTVDRKTVVKSFSCSRNMNFLETVMSAAEIKTDDLADIWESFSDNPTAGPYPFNFLRNNWETLYKEYSDTDLGLLCTMLHVAIRGLNSLADLEVLQIFVEKYFGSTVENRNPTLLEVLHFEEEILRQKILWQEKYEGVISGWISPKVEKFKNNLTKSQKEIGGDKTEVDSKVDGGAEQVNPGTIAGTVHAEKETSSVLTEVADSVGAEKNQSADSGASRPYPSKLISTNGMNPGTNQPATAVLTEANSQTKDKAGPPVGAEDTEKSATAVENAATATTENAPTVVEKAPVAVENAPPAVEKAATTTIEKAQTVVEKVPVAVENVPPAVEKAATTTIEKAQTVVEKAPVAVENAPTAVKDLQNEMPK